MLRTSVVVCTMDRPGDLRALLMSLEGQTRMADEIVIVDASESPAVRSAVVPEFGHLPIRYLRVRPPSVRRQRNLGMRHSRGDVVIYVDDDVILERSSALEGLAFDENLFHHVRMEDGDMAARLVRRSRIYYEPGARLHHVHSAVARPREYWRQRNRIVNQRYVLEKNWPLTIGRRAVFWWSVVGVRGLHALSGRWESLRGAVAGARAVLSRTRGSGVPGLSGKAARAERLGGRPQGPCTRERE